MRARFLILRLAGICFLRCRDFAPFRVRPCGDFLRLSMRRNSYGRGAGYVRRRGLLSRGPLRALTAHPAAPRRGAPRLGRPRTSTNSREFRYDATDQPSCPMAPNGHLSADLQRDILVTKCAQQRLLGVDSVALRLRGDGLHGHLPADRQIVSLRAGGRRFLRRAWAAIRGAA